ncbi:MAG: FAD-dependent oxidoreductase [Patescibacteria group bacterium]|nr:FAD-dependent oxidoreductase [Patescibacteria group bacterium]
MAATRYLIIGGGITGTTAADTIRKADPDGEITIISDEPYRLYSRIMISKTHFFLGKVPFEQIWLKKESWYPENNIRLIAGRTAAKLDATAKSVTLDDGTVLAYDKLLLALGICARRWGIPGADKRGVHYVRTVDDFRGIQEDMKGAKQAIVVGGGAIGFEMCEQFRLSGLETALSIREPHYWDPVLDETSGHIIEAALEKAGVKIYRGQYVKEATGGERLEGVTLEDGTRIPCQVAAVGIGGVCPHKWAADGGVKVSRGVVVNEYLETSVPDVWAAGDAAEYHDLIFDETVQFGSWSNAQQQGKLAGANMTGEKKPYKLVTFYAVSGLGINIAFVGNVAPVPGRQVVPRGSAEANAYGRVILKDNRVVGATLLNRTPEIGCLVKLIENKVDLSGRLKELGDPAVDLKSLL